MRNQTISSQGRTLFGGTLLCAGIATATTPTADAGIDFSSVYLQAFGGFDNDDFFVGAAYAYGGVLDAIPYQFAADVDDSSWYLNIDSDGIAMNSVFGDNAGGIVAMIAQLTVTEDTLIYINYAFGMASTNDTGFTVRDLSTNRIIAGALTSLGDDTTGSDTVTLLAGRTYQLELRSGEAMANTASQFSFLVPTPPAFAAVGAFSLVAARRRR